MSFADAILISFIYILPGNKFISLSSPVLTLVFCSKGSSYITTERSKSTTGIPEMLRFAFQTTNGNKANCNPFAGGGSCFEFVKHTSVAYNKASMPKKHKARKSIANYMFISKFADCFMLFLTRHYYCQSK